MNINLFLIANLSLLLFQTNLCMKKSSKKITKPVLKEMFHTKKQQTVGSIVDYRPEFAEEIKKISLPYTPHLTTMYYSFKEEDCLKAYKRDVEPAFSSKNTITKIYCVDNKPVGFINYQIFRPLYAYFIFKNSIEGNIDHLLIAKEYQKKGLAKKLMLYALEDCKKNSVHKVNLSITLAGRGDNLDQFYHQFGFESGYTAGASAGGTQQFSLKLTASPFEIAKNNLVNAIKNL